MAHARAVVAEAWPGRPVHEASRSLQRIGPGKYVSRREDVFGVFDLLVFDAQMRAIQVTTYTGAGNRRTKVRRFLKQYPLLASFRPAVWVWEWVKGRHFRGYVWDWDLSDWRAAQSIPSPLLSARRTQKPPRQPSLPEASLR